MHAQDTTGFTRYAVADILDYLAEAVDAARVAAADSPTWLRALDKAWDHLLTVDTIEFRRSDHALRVESATEPGRFYTANGVCQCGAFGRHNACWHRAAARLVRRALELLGDDARETVDLAAELYHDAQAAGCTWYAPDIAMAGAKMRLPELADFAAEWDRDAAAMQAAALGTRIGAAQAEAMRAVAA